MSLGGFPVPVNLEIWARDDKSRKAPSVEAAFLWRGH